MRAGLARHVSRLVFVVAFSLVFVGSASTVFAETFDRLVIFGDSLSDPGNHFVAFGITAQPPFAPMMFEDAAESDDDDVATHWR